MDIGEVKRFVEHLSDKPWSGYTKADYSIEQWHAACLIHQHDGPPTSKDQCKLPVKTPNGAVNKNGVHSAAAALAGARGGVHASSEEKSSAARALIRYYRQMNEDPPPSLMRHSITLTSIEHHGVKGMHWGVRSARTPRKQSSESKKVSELIKKKPHELTNKQLKTINERKNLEQNFTRLNPSTVKKGLLAAGAILSTATLAANFYNIMNGPAGKAAIAAGKKFMTK